MYQREVQDGQDDGGQTAAQAKCQPGVLQKLEEEDVKDAPTPGVSEPRNCCHYLISKVQPTTDQMEYNRPESLFKNTKIFSH